MPYAEPPIGKNRFLRPEKIRSWPKDEILDASNPSEIHCMQPDDGQTESQTEDCLYLWVYSPAICNSNTKGTIDGYIIEFLL